MKVFISSKIKRAYSIRGHLLKDRLWQPIIMERPAKFIFRLKFEDCGNTKSATVQPKLVYGSNRQFYFMYPVKEISLEQKEQVFTLDFTPTESERHEFQLILPEKTEVHNDYGAYVEGTYAKPFFVHTFFNYFLFWFAGLSTVGALVEIINLLIILRLHL